MGIISKVLEKRSLYDATSDYWYYPVNKQTASGVNVDEYNALECGDVYKCVRVIAETIASLPLHVYKRLKEGGKERATEHLLYPILHFRPNTEMTKFSFWETALSHLLTWGNFYAEIESNIMGEILNLWPLRPDRMEVTRGQGSDLLQYEYRPTDGKAKITFSSDEIFHIPGLGFNGITGYSPITMAREAIGLGKAAEEFASRFFENDATPGGVLQHPGKLTKEGRDNLKSSWNERHQGVSRKFKFAVLEEGMTWKEISVPMKDVQFLELRKFQRTDICGIFRVPPHMIGDLERATFSNIEQQSIDFVVNTIRPWLVRIEQAILFKLFSERDQKKYFAEHTIEGLLRGDIASRYAAYSIGKQWGWLSSDDIREIENMNPLPDGQGKIYLIPMNMIDAKKINEKPPQEAPKEIPKIELKPEEIKKIEEKIPKKEQKNDIVSAVVETSGLSEITTQLREETTQSDFDNTPRVDNNLSQRYKDIKPAVAIDAAKLSHGFKRIWEDGVARVIRRESIAIHRAIKRQDISAFETHLDGFYHDLPEFMSATLHPPMISYCEMVNSTGASNCISKYIENHIKESRSEVAKWAGMYIFSTTSDGSIRTNVNAIDDCLDIWTEKRPEQAAEFFGNFFSTS